jgi:hypothetical protein
MVTCKICGGSFKDGDDSVVMCAHHGGAVHMGCCIDNCSGDGMPCEHSHGVYEKK